MDTLPLIIEDALFRYTQVTREGTLAIYTQEHKPSGVCRYELIRIRVQRAWTPPGGTLIPAHEVYPSASRWGREGWTFYHEDAARAAMVDLQRQQRQAVAP